MEGTAGMITKEACVKACGRKNGERGVKRARNRDLPRRSVEILRDLGLSKDKIVAYHRRFPTPTPTTGSGSPQLEGDPDRRRQARSLIA
jgi:hypothetical protein